MSMMGGKTCPDCHMGTATSSSGTEYTSHTWTSPLNNQALIDSSCKSCHADLAGDVDKIQKAITARELAISKKLADLHDKIGKAAGNGSKTDAELAALRATLRDAQFYWDFCFVENSEGAHNSTFAKALLDKAEQLVDQALAKF
jgi:nitrite reductase (cytochrome c-552)